MVDRARALGSDCPEAFDQAVPAEDVGPEASPGGDGVLPARAGSPEVVAVPLEVEMSFKQLSWLW